MIINPLLSHFSQDDDDDDEDDDDEDDVSYLYIHVILSNPQYFFVI